MADDCTWANRMVFHVVDIVRFCFGEESADLDQSHARYDELANYSKEWYQKKPLSFLPIYFKGAVLAPGEGLSPATAADGTSGLFPEIWLMSDAVATGLLHYHLGMILLLAYDPRAPRLGPNRTRFFKKQTEEIKKEVTAMVGIARWNRDCQPNCPTACLGVAMAGERFDVRTEQEELMNFLKETQASSAWPTVTAQRHLSETWGWELPSIGKPHQ